MSWGPWLECDGAGFPRSLPFGRFTAEVRWAGDGLPPAMPITNTAPGLFWRWRRAGWFSSRRVRVCDDPAYAPIIALRVRRPDAMALLEALAASPRTVPIFLPEREVAMPDPALHGNGEDCPACALRREGHDPAAVLRPAVACNLCGGVGRIAIPTAEIIARQCAEARAYWAAFDARVRADA